MRCMRPVIPFSTFMFTGAQAADKFPDVDNYRNRWPVTDLIKMRLKNTSSRHRKLLQKMAAGKSGGKEMGVRLKSKVAHKQSKVLTFTHLY